jgi:hypothetical protein
MRYFVTEMVDKFKISLIILLLISISIFAQDKNNKINNQREVFAVIEAGIDGGIVEKFSDCIGKQVFLSIRGGESGYYSSNQAYFILKNFMSSRKPLGFTFTTYGLTENIPFATGRAAFRYKRNREYFQIYVSLNQVEDSWVIDKINFY